MNQKVSIQRQTQSGQTSRRLPTLNSCIHFTQSQLMKKGHFLKKVETVSREVCRPTGSSSTECIDGFVMNATKVNQDIGNISLSGKYTHREGGQL